MVSARVIARLSCLARVRRILRTSLCGIPPSPTLPLKGGGRTTALASDKSQLSHDLTAKAVDDALAGERHDLDIARLSRLEPHGGAGRDIEPHAASLLAVELQRRIGLEEMIVRADLDRTVACVGNRQRRRLAAGIELNLAVLDEEFTGNHSRNLLSYLIGSCTVTSLVPSGKVAST